MSPTSPYKSSGMTRALGALRNSLRGLRVAWRSESALRQETLLAGLLLPLGLWLGRDGVERALLSGSVLLVPIVELLNTSLECAVDRISLERNDLSRQAKDLGSAAVLLTLLLCAATWALVLLPHWL
ncbi:MAG: diacylglycerol kinase [Betaproteobacteria bacterium]|nr:diacylglycerol kinase [Betaproteobacteria bacterium]